MLGTALTAIVSGLLVLFVLAASFGFLIGRGHGTEYAFKMTIMLFVIFAVTYGAVAGFIWLVSSLIT